MDDQNQLSCRAQGKAVINSPKVKFKSNLFLTMDIIHSFLYSFFQILGRKEGRLLKFINTIDLLHTRMSQCVISGKTEWNNMNEGKKRSWGVQWVEVIGLRTSGL